MNIDYTESLREISAAADIWCDASASAGSLVSAADVALRAGAMRVATAPMHINIMWSWMEGKNVDVFAAFQEQEAGNAEPAKLVAEIHAVFKKGAAGVILPRSTEIMSALLPVRQDLFFGKKLFLSVCMRNIGPQEWAEVFRNLKEMHADGILLDARDVWGKGGNKRLESIDIVGKFYGFLDSFDNGFSGQISVIADSPRVMESIWRLACKMRPEAAKKLRFFVEHK